MAEVEDISTADPPCSPAQKPGGAVRLLGVAAAVWEWLWGGRSLGQARADASAGAAAALYAQEARRAASLAARAIDPAEPLPHGRSFALACELLRQSAYFALLALRVERTSDAQCPVDGDYAGCWRAADASLLEELETDADARGRVADCMTMGSFAGFVAMPPEELEPKAKDLTRFVEAALRVVDAPRNRVDNLLTWRVLRLLGVAMAVLALVGGWRWASVRWDASRDLAIGHAWRTSSQWVPFCVSPHQVCPQGKLFFFHTQDDPSPWVEFDLGTERWVSGVRVDNRIDCCSERVVPLVVEVSRDHVRFTEVARETEVFESTKIGFGRVQARWVRLRVDRPSILHLRRVRILP